MMAFPLRNPCTFYSSAIAVFFWLCFLAADAGKTKIYKMGTAGFCKSAGDKPRWLAEKSSAIVIGKSKFPWSSSCSIVLGAATEATKNVRLRIQFDFIYFDSCGVKLQINQSSTSDFKTSKDNREMFMSGCNHHNPGPLYAQPKHYILISLDKENRGLLGYNFRLNVTMAANLPVTGTPLHVVIIVSFVCFMVVVTAAFVLFKYAVQMSEKWSEEHREEVIDRAIDIYHTQEASGGEESTMVYMEPGYGVRAGRRADRPELAFVRGDGRVERFQPLDDRAKRNASDAENHPKSAQKGVASRSSSRGGSPGEEPTHFYISFPPDGGHHSGRGGGAAAGGGGTDATSTSYMNDAVETSSVGGLELPPSYEEALSMPLPVSAGGEGGGSGDASGGDGSDGSRVVNGAACGASVSVSPLARGNNDTKSPVTTTTATPTTATARGGEDDEDLINLEMTDEESEPYMNLGGNLQLLGTPPDGVKPEKEEVEA